jgi:hypothetical protein
MAQDWTFKVNGTLIGGIDKFGFDTSDKQADSRVFEDHGAEAHLVTGRGKTMKLTGKYQEEESGEGQDPGQAAIEALSNQIGLAAIFTFMVISPGGKERSFKASVKMDEIGGGNDDTTTWGCTITRTGPDL